MSEPAVHESEPGAARIAVIGAGIGGLAVARALRAHGVDVVVYEASGRAGGVIRTSHVDGFVQEHAANGFLSTPGGALDLAHELGVEVVEASSAARNRWIYRHGALHAVPSDPVGLLTSDLLSWRGKLAALAEPLRPPRPGLGAGMPAGDESVLDFARRRLGDEVAEALVAPFVTGVFAGRAEALSVQAAFPTLVALEREGGLVRGMVRRQLGALRRRLAQKLAGRSGRPAEQEMVARGSGAAAGGKRPRTRLSAPAGGMEALARALAADLGDALRLDTAVAAVVPGDDGVRIALANGEVELVRTAVLATPAHVSAGLLRRSAPALATLLADIPYAPVAIVYLGFERAEIAHPLDGFGFLVAEGEDVRVLGTVFESVLWPERAPAGRVLLRCILGGGRDPDVMALDDGALVDVARRDLRRVLGIDAAPVHIHVVRWSRAIPQYPLGHVERVERAEAMARPLGLVLAGNAYHSVAVNGLIADARRVAGAVLSQIQGSLALIVAVLALCAVACAGSDRAAAADKDADGAAPRSQAPRVSRGAESGAAPRAGAGEPAPRGAARQAAAETGAVHVTVAWPDAPASVRRSSGRNDCDVARRPAVHVHTLGGVRDAVVGLLGVPPAREAGAAAEPVVVSVHQCQAGPRVALMSQSTGTVAIVNHDERRHRVRVEHMGVLGQDAADGARPAREIALPVVGSRLDVPVAASGMLRIGGTAEPAYVVAPAHAHVAMTDDTGDAQLEHVPAGTYELIAWYPPLREGGAPLEARQPVTVEAGHTATVSIALATP